MRLSWRPTLRVETLVLAVLVYILAILNGSWWSTVLAGRRALSPSSWLFAAGVLLALIALHLVVVVVLANRWTAKPLLAVLVVASAASAYYMRTYAVVLDPTMLQNVLHTDLHEARDLLSLRLIGSLLASSAVPLVLLARVRVLDLPWRMALGVRLATIVAAIAVAAVSLLTIGRDLTPLMRTQPVLRVRS